MPVGGREADLACGRSLAGLKDAPRLRARGSGRILACRRLAQAAGREAGIDFAGAPRDLCKTSGAVALDLFTPMKIRLTP